MTQVFQIYEDKSSQNETLFATHEFKVGPKFHAHYMLYWNNVVCFFVTNYARHEKAVGDVFCDKRKIKREQKVVNDKEEEEEEGERERVVCREEGKRKKEVGR